MSSKKVRVPTAQQRAQMDLTWGRYSRLVTGLRGLWGEILAIHLTVEAEIEDRLRLMIPHPDRLLARAGFDKKLELFQATWPGPEPIGGDAIQQIRRLNAIRNMVAHGGDDAVVAQAVHNLLCQTSQTFRQSGQTHDDAVEALRGLALSLCGFIVGVSEGDDFDALRRKLVEEQAESRL